MTDPTPTDVTRPYAVKVHLADDAVTPVAVSGPLVDKAVAAAERATWLKAAEMAKAWAAFSSSHQDAATLEEFASRCRAMAGEG